MSKIVKILSCDDCPYFDNEYYSYNEKCKKLNKVVDKRDEDGNRIIPEDCPLENG